VPKPSRVQVELPAVVAAQLRQLGEDLALARKRRRESRRVWAGRIGVSEPTLARMEAGDSAVSIGTYATALWLVGRASAIAALAAPQQDLGALENELRVAKQRSVRKSHSIERRLHAQAGQRSAMPEQHLPSIHDVLVEASAPAPSAATAWPKSPRVRNGR
jgi:transcriptional regulator with XRE-family HTH domain